MQPFESDRDSSLPDKHTCELLFSLILALAPLRYKNPRLLQRGLLRVENMRESTVTDVLSYAYNIKL